MSELVLFPSSARSNDDPERPKDPGFLERAERTLVQLTVRIRALTPEDRFQAAHLTKADFSLLVDLETIPPERFELDNYCPHIEDERPPEPSESSKHLMFYVDHLQLEGRDNTKAMLQQMIPRMAAEGYQMKTFPSAHPGWTGDVDQLLRDVSRLFDPVRSLPEKSGEPAPKTVRALLESHQVEEAIAVAEDEELASQVTFEGPALQLARAISGMADLPMPKAMIYFADSGYSLRELIVDTAIRSGVAIYAVKADGIAPYVPNLPLALDPGVATTSSLYGLSKHTGGAFGFGHFRKGAADKILKRVETDLSCIYVLSLDAAGLDRERILRTKIKLRSDLRNRLRAETIPEVTIPSERRRQEEAASIALRSGRWPGVQPAGISLVPIGFDKSRVDALIQFTLRSDSGAPSIPTAWNVGINYFGASHVSGYGNLRVTSRSPRIVFEQTVRLPIGPYSLVGTAQEVDGHGSARGTAVGVLDGPKKNAVGFLHPIDILQWGPGTFASQDRRARKVGWSSLRYAMAYSDRPISLVVSSCRGMDVHEPLTIEKSLLLPDGELRFKSTEWPQGEEAPCLVVNDDVLAAGRLPWSNQPYEATLVVNINDASGKTLATGSKVFWIVGPAR